ncbi:MAG: YvcK family protein [Oscillospiraceae bacterium]|nr:YvcK family protein [Oscillospiraceae bacterium]MBR2365786.1 YvcK family protein [Oscillospiraceae bacterium]MBR2896403.1 YvcK family protein [Oscillospiraceae bacterium]
MCAEKSGRPLRVVAIGGGHGLSGMLRGLKRYTSDITAIVTVADDGGSSGMLRNELGILPPGDIRNCILALSDVEPTMEQLLNYRFSEGSLSGQCFGNLFLAAMNGISSSFDEAVRKMSDILAITGRVLPVTTSDVRLEAEFDNGEKILGESRIFYAKKNNNSRIRRVRLLPENPPALPMSLRAIEEADVIIIGPGSLYTSIIPNFLVRGIGEAVAKAKAPKIFVMNIMTQEGETEECTGYDHIAALLSHAPDTITACLANCRGFTREELEPYRMEGVEPIRLEREKIESLGICVAEEPIAQVNRYIRHDSEKLAGALMELYHSLSLGG